MKQTTLNRLCLAGGALLLAAHPVIAQTPPSSSRATPAAAAGQDPTPPPAAPQLTTDQISRLFGLTFGSQMKSVGISNEVSIDAISRGIKEGLQGRQPTPDESRQLQAFVRTVAEAAVASNEKAAADFLATNTKDKNVVTTASGLQYKVLVAGDKKAPLINAADTVTVQYRGRLLDNSEFDSSYSRGVPATFPVTGVIKGWQEALVLMRPGSKYQLFVPPALGYGNSPKPKIPGGSLLMFDVEVIGVEPAGGNAGAPTAPPGTPTTQRKH